MFLPETFTPPRRCCGVQTSSFLRGRQSNGFALFSAKVFAVIANVVRVYNWAVKNIWLRALLLMMSIGLTLSSTLAASHPNYALALHSSSQAAHHHENAQSAHADQAELLAPESCGEKDCCQGHGSAAHAMVRELALAHCSSSVSIRDSHNPDHITSVRIERPQWCAVA